MRRWVQVPAVVLLSWAALSSTHQLESPLSLPVAVAEPVVRPASLFPGFEPNLGHFAPDVLFSARTPGLLAGFSRSAVQLALGSGSRRPVGFWFADGEMERLKGIESLGGHRNYLLGSDPSAWLRNVPLFGRVVYEQVYPGIDVVFYGNGAEIECDFLVATEADPEAIRIEFDRSLRFEPAEDGSLRARIADGELRLKRPVAYEVMEQGSRSLGSRYQLHGDRTITFKVEARRPGSALKIDPILDFSSHLGGSQFDTATSLVRDGSGNLYVAGMTRSARFPLSNPVDTTIGPGGLFKTTNGGGQWQPTGLSGVEVQAVAVAPTSGSTVYVSTYERGVLRSVDGGQSWQEVNSGLRSGVQVRHLAVSPTVPSVVYAADPSYVYRTENGGGSWVRLTASSVSPSGLIVDPRDHRRLWVWSSSRLFRSGDSGVTWVELKVDSLSGLSYLAISPSRPEVLYIAGYEGLLGPSLYRSEDGGDHWVKTGEPPKLRTCLVVHPRLPDTLYVLTSHEEAFVSRNQGKGWERLDGGNAPGMGLVIDSADPDTMYGLTAGASAAIGLNPGSSSAGQTGIHRSTDGGRTWEPATRGAPSSLFTAFGLAASNPAVLYAGVLPAADAFVTKLGPEGQILFSTFLGGDGDEAAAALGVDSQQRPVIGGWTTSVNFPVRSPLQAATAGGADGFVAKLTGDGSGFVYSTYFGGRGSDSIRDLELHSDGAVSLVGSTDSFDFPVTKSLTVSSGGGIFRSRDGGATWTPTVQGLESFEISALTYHPSGGGVLFAATDEGLFRSIDGGSTWAFSGTTLRGVRVGRLGYCEQAPEVMYASTAEGIYKSIDGGRDWARTPGQPAGTAGALAVHPTNPAIVFAAGGRVPGPPATYPEYSRGAVYRSTDGGGHWELAGTSMGLSSASSVVIDPEHPANVYVAGLSGNAGKNVYKSTDGGNTWMGYGSSFIAGPLAISRRNPSVLMVGAVPDGVVYRSVDSGVTWSSRGEGINSSEVGIASIHFDPNNATTVYAGTSNYGLYKSTNNGEGWTQVGRGIGSATVVAVAVRPGDSNQVMVAGGIESDGFIARISGSGNSLLASTLLGGSRGDSLRGIHLSGSGAVLVAGASESVDYPRRNSISEYPGGYFGNAPVVSSLSPSLENLEFSTFFNAWNGGASQVVEATGGTVWVTGSKSAGFPLVNPWQETGSGFLARLSPAGNVLQFGTCLDFVPRDLHVHGLTTLLLAGDADVARVDTSGPSLEYWTRLPALEINAVTAGDEGEKYVAGAETGFGFVGIGIPPAPSGSADLGGTSNAIVLKLRESQGEMYFPFHQAGGGKFTGFAVSNYSDRPATIQLHGFNWYGSLISVAGRFNPATLSLGPKQQTARLGSELFGYGSSHNGWIQGYTDNPGVGAFFLRGGAGFLDGSVAQWATSKRVFLPVTYMGSGAFRGQSATTYMSIANPYSATATVRCRLLDPAGAVREEVTRYVSARNSRYETFEAAFGMASLSDGFVDLEVTGGQGIVAFQTSEFASGATLIGMNGVPATGRTRFYSAQLANGMFGPGAGYFTAIKLVNTADTVRTVTLSAIADNGTPLAAEKQVELGPRSSVELDAGRFFGLGESTGSRTAIGSLQGQASGPGIVGSVIFGDPVGLRYAAATPLQFEPVRKAVFSQVANGLGMYTGLALFNPNPTTASVTVTVYSEEGARVGSSRLDLGPLRRTSQVIPQFVKASEGQVKGFILIESSQPVVVQQLFGDLQLNYLCSVPPTVAE